MDRQEYLQNLTVLLIQAEYAELAADPAKTQAVMSTCLNTVNLRPKSALRSVVRYLNDNNQMEALEQVKAGALQFGLATEYDLQNFTYPRYFHLLFWGLIALAVYGLVQIFN